MIQNFSSFSAHRVSPWSPSFLPETPLQAQSEIRKSGLGLWRGVAIGLPISLAIWAGVAGLLMQLF